VQDFRQEYEATLDEGLGGIEVDAVAFDDLPAPITPRSTRAQRMFAHEAKMAGKRYDRERRGPPESPRFFSRNQARRLTGYTSIAQGNRHTGKPHEHAREIMRNTMTPLQRRAFAAKVATALQAAA
jgi:hypothetical protein